MISKRKIVFVIIFLIAYQLSQATFAISTTQAAVKEGHNNVSCEPLPINDGKPSSDDIEQVDLTDLESNNQSSKSENTWKTEWTGFAMECMDKYAKDFLDPNKEIPKDYQEYCGAPIRQHVDAERRLFLLSVLVATAKYESGFNSKIVADLKALEKAGAKIGDTQTEENPPTGLFQMGLGDCIEGESCDLTDPKAAICIAIKKANDQIAEDEVFAGCKNENVKTCKGDDWGGMAAYWEVHRTMSTNEAIYKTNAIKNAVRGVCGCTGRDARSGGAFSNLPEDWLQAAVLQSRFGRQYKGEFKYHRPTNRGFGAQ